MLIKVRDLVNIKDEKTINVDEKVIVMENDPYLKRLENVKGQLNFFYDYDDKLKIEYNLSGQMICPDAFTLEDVSVDFNLNEEDILSFNEMEEGFYIRGDLDLNELILNICLPEVPIKVEKSNKTSYHYGDDWSVLSEEEYDKGQKEKIDIRIEKIFDYKEEE